MTDSSAAGQQGSASSAASSPAVGPRRELPAHIAAQLASAGRATDTGGQPWEGRNLGEGTSHTHQFPDDTGQTDPGLQAALQAFAAGQADELAVFEALRQVRVFAPVLAQLSQAHITEEGLVSDKESEMALVSLQAPDGRKTLPLFTSVQDLTNWHQQARPVASSMRKTALAAIEDGNQLVVLNPGSPLPFVLRRPAIWALAKNEPWLPSYQDPQVQQILSDLATPLPGVLGLETSPGPGIFSRAADGSLLAGGGAGPELKITLKLLPGLRQEQVDASVAALQQGIAQNRYLSEAVDSIQLALVAG